MTGSDAGVEAFVELPDTGRRYSLAHRVRLGDVGPAGRVRLDAVARHLQDVAGEDGDASGVGGVWVLRRTAMRVHGRLPVLGDDLELVTACSGSGSRWAERRTVVTAPQGRIDAAAIWVLIDRATGRPQALPAEFAEVYGPAAAGRKVSARLRLPSPPEGAPARPWPLRATDFDVLGHVNNARYWEAVEDVLAGEGSPRVAAAVLEFRAELGPGDQPVLRWARDGSTLGVWLCSDSGGVHAAAEVTLSEA